MPYDFGLVIDCMFITLICIDLFGAARLGIIADKHLNVIGVGENELFLTLEELSFLDRCRLIGERFCNNVSRCLVFTCRTFHSVGYRNPLFYHIFELVFIAVLSDSLAV